jgi:hypothetical protein
MPVTQHSQFPDIGYVFFDAVFVRLRRDQQQPVANGNGKLMTSRDDVK